MNLRAGDLTPLAALFARLALGAGFLSAVADRFGLWGPPGAPGVAWGSFDHFLAYTGHITWPAPEAFVPLLGWAATSLEIVLGAALILGVFLRPVSLASGILLLVFGLAMSSADGLKSPLDASVFGAAAAAFLLATVRCHLLALGNVVDRRGGTGENEAFDAADGAHL